MSRFFYRMLPVLLFMAMPSVLFASAVQNDTLIARFLVVSGIESQIRELPGIVMMQFEQEKEPFGPAAQLMIRKTLTRAFHVDSLLNDARHYLKHQSDPVRIAETLDQLDDPFIRQMNLLELERGHADQIPARDAFLARLDTIPPAESRVQLLLEFDALILATEQTVDVITNLYMAMIRAMNPQAPEGRILSEAQLVQAAQSIRDDLLPVYETVNLMVNLFTYESVSDADLAEYIEFYKTDTGRWYVENSYAVIAHVIEAATRRVRNYTAGM